MINRYKQRLSIFGFHGKLTVEFINILFEELAGRCDIRYTVDIKFNRESALQSLP